MTNSRWLLRILLVVLIVAGLGLGYWRWVTTRADYYFQHAEAAVKAEDYDAARLYLVKLVVRYPDHAEGHELLSQVILLHAQSIGRVPSFAANPEAVNELAKAAELRPDDEELQARLLRACVLAGQFERGVPIAEKIYAKDKTSGDAHLALTWAAVMAKDKDRAERLFAETKGVKSQNVFQEIAMKVSFYEQLQDGTNANKSLLEAVEVANGYTGEQLKLLTANDRRMMLQLLLTCQRRSKNEGFAKHVSSLIDKLCAELRKADLLDDETLKVATTKSQELLNGEQSASGTTEERNWLEDDLFPSLD